MLLQCIYIVFLVIKGVKMSDMLKGKVKWFDARKGYGFIEKEDGTDIFCHFSVVNVEGYKTLKDGQEVEFEIESNEKGERAKNVTPL